jgi:hypothetical protein
MVFQGALVRLGPIVEGEDQLARGVALAQVALDAPLAERKPAGSAPRRPSGGGRGRSVNEQEMVDVPSGKRSA